jgi:DNA invertase Pin-like site-specific DNA recombinase
MATDIVDYILKEIRDALPEMSTEELQAKLSAVETKTRSEWGGDAAYVAKKKNTTAQKQKAVAEYLGGKPFSKIRETTGVGRATLYRHLKKAD